MSAVEIDSLSPAADPLSHISEMTSAKVRTFLFEVAEGVSNYRSLHSLTQQVEHQYHGRFLIELLQNAHDAFIGSPTSEHPNRIEIVFDSDDSEHGSLLVANDGEPFSSSNFERLSQLGQSDKDPQQSIGNKGIGFRSVLEVSERPEVYSRSNASSGGFDGYCFAFRPEVVQSLVGPMITLANDGPIPNSPISDGPIVDWSEDLLRKFRKRVRAQGVQWLTGECKYLSPYLLPVPLDEIQSPAVKILETQRFATVVRLPLKSAELRHLVLHHMEQLSSSTILFLDKVSSLTLRVPGEMEQAYTRKSSELAGSQDGARVTIHESTTDSREYAVWSRRLHVASASPEFRAAVSALPGRWPEIEDISVSVAVRLGDIPEAGRFSIYLPTLVVTGSAVHINAPFFGDMSRTSISFDDAYNRQLLQTAGDLAIVVVRERLAGRGHAEARAIIDLISPFGNDQAACSRWTQLMNESADRSSVSLEEEPLILAEAAWRPLNMTSLVPDTSKTTLLTEDLLRSHATFDIFHSCLSSRRGQLEALAIARFPEIGAYPLESDVAATVASIALDLQSNGGDWNAFWRDVIVLLPRGQRALAEYEVLLGGDGKLHRVGGSGKVFFVPRQGTQDDGDVGGEGSATDVPLSLQPSVAFLSDQIQTYELNKPTVQTHVRAYLGNGLVSQFRVDTIFTGVLQELTPPLPVPIEGPHFESCRDILLWALRLIGNIVARGRGAEATLRLLRTIPVPCQGGWYAMGDASFGEGWSATSGVTLTTYLEALGTTAALEARKRLLLPPGSPAWGGIGIEEQALLKVGGVFDGLRLHEIRSEAWDSGFRAASYDFILPPHIPPGLSKEYWAEYKKAVESETRPPFSSLQPYAVGSLFVFPGLAEAPSLSDQVRAALCELVLQSLPLWSRGLEPLGISKQGGQADRRHVTSALKYFLQSAPWLAIRDANRISWARPLDRWHVPADAIAGRARHFAHLKALPSSLARRLDINEPLAKLLHELGMPHFDLHTETASPRLIEALTASIGSDDVPDANVLLGQLRDAWHRFRPPTNLPAMTHLIVRRQDKQLVAVVPTAEAPVFLPDYGSFVTELEQFGLPVLTIYPEDAKSLKEWFESAYGQRVQLTSKLDLVPRVNGTPWTGVSAVPIADSELGWLIPPLLALVAFYGQLRGIHSAAFQERLDLLRQTRVDWVTNAEVAVMRDKVILMTSPMPALWDADRKTLIVTNFCRENPADLSAALSQALRRDDLELPLRVVLSRLESLEAEPEDVSGLLSQLRISAEQVQQVIEHLRGDVGHMSRLLQMLFAVIAPNIDGSKLVEAKTEDDLATAIAAAGIVQLDPQRTLRVARESQDMFDFGRSMWRELGPKASLSRWNLILGELDQPRLVNRNWSTQLQAGFEEAAGLVKRVMAQLIRRGSPTSFVEMLSAYDALIRTADLSGSHWEVDFQASMGIVADLVRSWQGGEELSTTVREARSAEDLRERLSAVGVQLDLDPDECCRRNHQLVDTVASSIERLRLAWWLKAAANEKYGEWRSDIEGYRAAASGRLANLAFTEIWSEARVFDMLRGSEQHIGCFDFWSAMVISTDVGSLQAALQVSNEELTGIEARLAAMRAESQRLRSVVKVCDEDFDGSEENRKQLWTFLQNRVEYELLAATQPLDLGKTLALLPVKPKKGGDLPKPPLLPVKKLPRQTKAVDELVGLAGEIFVYQMLRQRYGSDVVSSSSWVSENSKYVFPHNKADDGRGCDFAFTIKGTLHRIEVKSSSSDDESFTLGSSEISLAMELASKKRGRRELFMLVHVKNALSAAPQAVVLPNPYDPRSAGMFSIEKADARVRYKPKTKNKARGRSTTVPSCVDVPVVQSLA
jgi:hypothetical protein